MPPNRAWIALVVTTSLALGGCQSSSAPGVGNGVTAANITVNFQAPENFRDVRDTPGGPPVPAYLDLLARHLQERAPAFLRTGQQLTVTFADIDLAGDFPPSPRVGMNAVRIIRDVYRPRMDLYFAVHDAKGRLVKDGARVLQDLNFQAGNAKAGSANAEPLYHDKALLTAWLEDEFPPAAARRRYYNDGYGQGSSPGSDPWLRTESSDRGSVENVPKK